MVCSFCKKRVRTSRLHLSAHDTQSGSYICKTCLSVCRQIVASEAREGSFDTKTLKSRKTPNRNLATIDS